MSYEFIAHITISAIIFYIISAWFKFFLKLKGNLDLSYLAIIIFGSYLGAILNIELGIWMIAAISIAFLASLWFTFFVLFLSKKLDEVYFTLWTFALYILVFQLAINLEWITWGALWLSWMTQNILWSLTIQSITWFLIFAVIVVFLIILWLTYFKSTFFYKTLKWWWEREIIVKSLWVRINRYKFVMVLITTFLAVVGWNLFSFYYLYIDPQSFRLGMLILVLLISFLSYKFNDLKSLLIAMIVLFIYEYLRFFKIVEPSKIGYFREIIFALLIMISAFIVFRKTTFSRDH